MKHLSACRSLLLLLGCWFAGHFDARAQSQNVGIGTTTPDAKAALDVSSTNKGVLLPRLSKAQRLAISAPPQGLMVFQTAPDSVGFWYYAGTRWLWMPDAQTAANTTTAGNGITKTGNNIALGGSLTGPTVVAQGNQNLSFTSTAGLVVDQQNTSTNSSLGIGSWQSFTAGTSGGLKEVSVSIYTYAPSPYNGSVVVYAGTGIGGAVLGSAPLTQSNLDVYEVRTATFGTPIALTSGQVYTILVTSGGSSTFWAMNNGGDPYPGGRNNWSATSDFYFITRLTGVNVPVLALSGGQVGVGVSTPTAALDVNGSARVRGLNTAGVVTTDANGNLSSVPSASLADNMGNHNATTNLSLADREIYLRGTSGSDGNHGLGWYGSGKLWNGFNLDGPVLYGNVGGMLGTNSSGTRVTALYWNNSGRVGIGTTSPSALLDVNGATRLRGLTTAGVVTTDASGNLSSQTIASIQDNLGNHTATTTLNLNGNTISGGGSANVGIASGNTLEMGAGVAGKEVNAGKIGYATFTTGALDIVGAGTTTANRRIKLWAEGGTEINGNVGIGTASPSALLDVNGATRLRGLTTAGVVTTDASGNLSSATAAALDATTASNGLTRTGTNLTLGGTLTGATTISQGGNLLTFSGANGSAVFNDFPSGLGTVLVTTLNGTSLGPQMRFRGVGNPLTSYMDIGQNSAGDFVIEGNDAARLTVQNAGNVGIGTASPSALLDVNGSTRLRGLTTAGVVTTDASGNLASQTISSIQDNLGNHTATQNLNMGTNALTGNGASITGVGIGIRADGGINIGQNTTGNNVLIGYFAGNAGPTGAGNTFIGNQTGRANTSGAFGTFIGNNAGWANTTGSSNTFIGWNAGSVNTTGNQIFAVGHQAGQNNTASNNHFEGFQAGTANSSGSENMFVGFQAGTANTTGNVNMFVGYQAGLANTTGVWNHFDGYRAGISNTTGNYNTYIGYRAGEAAVSASENMFVGHRAGQNATAGQNFAVGHNAGAGLTTGTQNTVAGLASGQATTTGNNNTFYGYFAGSINTTGANNWAFGYNAGPSLTNLTNAGAIGYQAQVSQSNSLVLGGTGANAVSVGIGTAAPSATLHVVGGARITGLTTAGVVTTDASGNLSSATAASLDATTASNGLTRTGNNITLGGTLTGNTTLATGTNSLNLTGSITNTAVDQSQLIASGNTIGTAIAQSFTAGITGQMTQLDVYLISPAGTGTPASGTLRIYAGAGTGGTLLLSQAITYAAGAAGFQSFTLSTPVAVTASQPYTFQLLASGVSANWIYFNFSNPYAGGQTDAVAFWDMAFRTYVQTTQTPPSLTVLGSGNVGVGTASPTSALDVNGTTRLRGLTTAGVVTTDASGNLSSQTIASIQDNLGNHTATANLYLNSTYDVLLRGTPASPDLNHGIGYYGAGKLWNGVSIDGPAVYGFTGGVLGTNQNGTRNSALYWNGSGQVGIGNTAPSSSLQVSGTIATTPVTGIAGGTSGSPTLLSSANSSYLGLSPANGSSNNYRLPDPGTCPGRMYVIRNNSGTFNAVLTTAAGLLFNGSGSGSFANYTLGVNSAGKTIIVFSDGANWTIGQLN